MSEGERPSLPIARFESTEFAPCFVCQHGIVVLKTTICSKPHQREVMLMLLAEARYAIPIHLNAYLHSLTRSLYRTGAKRPQLKACSCKYPPVYPQDSF